MNKTLISSAIIGLLALTGSINVANANLLEIVNGSGGIPNPSSQEAIGDPGGTNYTNAPTTGASAGPGMPSNLGNWPSSTNFAADSSFGGNLGITGYDGSYLKLDQAGMVTFEFMGKGDAGDHDIFQLWLNGAWTTIWDNQSSSNGTCGVTGTTPNCPYSGSSFSTFIDPTTSTFGNNLIAFQFKNLTTGGLTSNDGINNIKENANGPAYFLGVDPYLTSNQYQTSGSAVYAGLTDLPGNTDHDYDDLTVRVSVPEPSDLLLLSAGLLGLGFMRRRSLSMNNKLSA
ncbi:MAG: PEP-CTERM sorting domain-containing protein [Methylococcales bacterium]